MLNHGEAEITRPNLGNLNPIYERKLDNLDVHQVKGRRKVSRDGEGGKGCWQKYPERGEMRVPTVEGQGGAQGERDVRRGDGVSETDGYVSFSRFHA